MWRDYSKGFYRLSFFIIILLIIYSCKEEESGPVDVNIGLQNRGTVIGKVFINEPYNDENAQFTSTISNADIRFTTGGTSTIKTTKYRTKSNSNGEFMIELPAGSYDVYGYYYYSYYGRSWGVKTSVIVTRGSTVNMEVKLRWQDSVWGVYF